MSNKISAWMLWVSSLFLRNKVHVTWVDAKITAIFDQCNVLKWIGKHISHHNCNGCKNTCYLGDKWLKGGKLSCGWGVWVWNPDWQWGCGFNWY